MANAWFFRNLFLKRIDLCKNKVGEIGASKLREITSAHTNLEWFSLEQNNVGEECNALLRQIKPRGFVHAIDSFTASKEKQSADVLKNLKAFAWSLNESGRCVEAKLLSEEISEVFSCVLGSDQDALIQTSIDTSIDNAVYLTTNGKFAEAERELVKLLEVLARSSGLKNEFIVAAVQRFGLLMRP